MPSKPFRRLNNARSTQNRDRALSGTSSWSPPDRVKPSLFPLIVTTNLPFGEWSRVFPDPRLAKAVVDRITHKAHIIDTGTESWRFRHGLQRKARKQT